jgi:hypothetical protein
MAILHVSYSDIQKWDWDELVMWHGHAVDFYKMDKEAAVTGMASAVAHMFAIGVTDGS